MIRKYTQEISTRLPKRYQRYTSWICKKCQVNNLLSHRGFLRITRQNPDGRHASISDKAYIIKHSNMSHYLTTSGIYLCYPPENLRHFWYLSFQWMWRHFCMLANSYPGWFIIGQLVSPTRGLNHQFSDDVITNNFICEEVHIISLKN